MDTFEVGNKVSYMFQGVPREGIITEIRRINSDIAFARVNGSWIKTSQLKKED